MIKEILIDFLTQGKNIEFLYEGKKRIYCPHILGMKNGKINIFGIQFGGSSSQPLDRNGNWRCFNISKISKIKDLKRDFKTLKSNISFKSRCIDTIIIKHPDLK